MNSNELKWYHSWPVIILFTLCFWPIAVGLLLSRLSVDRSAGFLAGGLVKWAGIGVAGLFGLVAIGLIADGTLGPSVIALLFTAGGIWMYRVGARMTKTAKNERVLIALIVNQEQRSIDTIATMMDRSNDVAGVLREVNQMMQVGKLPGFQLDPNARVLTKLAPTVSATVEASAPLAIFTCRGCGANNKVVRIAGAASCEYCGTPAAA